MHLFNLLGVLYLGFWFFGGMIVLRDARWQPAHIRTAALVCAALGPVTIVLYCGVRSVGHRLLARVGMTTDMIAPNRPHSTIAPRRPSHSNAVPKKPSGFAR